MTGPGGVWAAESVRNQWGIKLMTKLFKTTAFAAVTAAMAAATPAMAQVSDSAQGSATVKIYTPISIAPATGRSTLDFGTLVGTKDGSGLYTAADFTIDAVDSPSLTSFCQTDWTCSGVKKSAKFDISGYGDADVTVTLDDSVTLDNGGVGTGDSVDVALKLSVDDTAATGQKGDVKLSAAGAASVYVGGTLSVEDVTKTGVFSGNFNITAEYK